METTSSIVFTQMIHPVLFPLPRPTLPLDLPNRNNITAKGVYELSKALESNITLYSLNLEGQRPKEFGQAGVEPLAKLLGCNQILQRLNVKGCGIGNEGATCLLLALREVRSKALEGGNPTGLEALYLGLESTDEEVGKLAVQVVRTNPRRTIQII